MLMRFYCGKCQYQRLLDEGYRLRMLFSMCPKPDDSIESPAAAFASARHFNLAFWEAVGFVFVHEPPPRERLQGELQVDGLRFWLRLSEKYLVAQILDPKTHWHENHAVQESEAVEWFSSKSETLSLWLQG